MNNKSHTDVPAAPRKPVKWSEIFAALDRAGIPEDFLSDRDLSPPQERPNLQHALKADRPRYGRERRAYRDRITPAPKNATRIPKTSNAMNKEAHT